MSYFYLSSTLRFSEACTKVIFKALFVLFQFFSYLSLGLKNHLEKTYIADVLDIIFRLQSIQVSSVEYTTGVMPFWDPQSLKVTDMLHKSM